MDCYKGYHAVEMLMMTCSSTAGSIRSWCLLTIKAVNEEPEGERVTFARASSSSFFFFMYSSSDRGCRKG